MAPSLARPDESDGGASSWTASLRTQLPWLPSPNSSNLSIIANDQEIEVMVMTKKLNDISTCLDQGVSVDLWKLRELALSHGGFISQNIRKRAWPKLVGAHQQVLLHAAAMDTNNNNNNTSEDTPTLTYRRKASVEVTRDDMILLETDLAQPTVWNIEDLLSKNRLTTTTKKVSFALPGLAAVSPTGSLVAVDKASSSNDGTTSPLATTPQPVLYASSAATTTASSVASTVCSSTLSLFSRSAQEKAILKNTIVSLLRTLPENEDPTSPEDRFHYYHGLQDLTSILLINLESPSLTSIMLKKLATFSLEDTLRHGGSMERAVHVLVDKLLYQVDPTLYDHVEDDVVVVSGVVGGWIPSWFSSVVKNFQMASRLVDVLLVSHATMPIYLAVALTCRYRDQLLQASALATSTLERAMRHLPKRLLREDDPMEALEHVIQVALEYIRLYPPHSLVATTPSTCAMLKESPPDWTMAAQAPTDYTLLQQARVLRIGGTVEEEPNTTTTTSLLFQTRYPLAMAAMGQAQGLQKRRQTALLIVLVVGIAALSILGYTQGVVDMSRNNNLIVHYSGAEDATVSWRLPVVTTKTTGGSSVKTNKSRKTRARRNKKTATTPPKMRALVAWPSPPPPEVSVAPPKKGHKGLIKIGRQLQKEKLVQMVHQMKQWKREHLNRDEIARLATIALVQSDKLRWKGQRFLI